MTIPGLKQKKICFDDIVELAMLFLLVPLMVNRLVGLHIHIIPQALIFFGVLAAIGGIADLPFTLYDTFVLEKKYGFSTITWKIWISRSCQVPDCFRNSHGHYDQCFYGFRFTICRKAGGSGRGSFLHSLKLFCSGFTRS